ncbi:hypothetical protein HYFRA_00005340 [Hymenoscyphus fraxineus]|uniref:Cytochrome P450 n=1 Tax=Hymenoscyphus fraxineus TaxID=746836 RepID=A0A9N9Q0B0_9HELO|nr:hypothetical protein HYFRA_00005340 [Hymenoscyphus fraxineus]
MDNLILYRKDLNIYHISLFAFASTVVYLTGLAIYRLYFHPLAKFPGPRLAALTQWVETYHELFNKEGGQFYFVYTDWHKKYGPIIRISPNELHIQDSTFYNTLYSGNKHYDKLTHIQYRFGIPHSSFATSDYNHHRLRRGAINPFFSRRKIMEHSPAVQKRVDRICERLQSDFMGVSRVLGLNEMWGCLTSDVIVEYCFGNIHNFIETPDFKAEYTQAIVDLIEPIHWVTQFSSLATLAQILPGSLVRWLSPQMVSVHKFNNDMIDQVQQIIDFRAQNGKSDGKNTVFNALLDSDLPPEELSLHRIQNEAVSLVGAGIDTTAKALSTTCFYLLSNPSVLQKLQEELDRSMPDPANMVSYDELAKLPYLSAVVEEGLRLAYGVVERLPRIVTGSPLPYGDWVLPTGFPVSMDTHDVATDNAIFTDPKEFRPERWLGDALAPDGKKLSTYQVSFSKGPRSCVGLQLAYAELTMGIASVFRRFNLTLHDTDRSSVEYYMNLFVPRAKPGVHGVEVFVQSLRA